MLKIKVRLLISKNVETWEICQQDLLTQCDFVFALLCAPAPWLSVSGGGFCRVTATTAMSHKYNKN